MSKLSSRNDPQFLKIADTYDSVEEYLRKKAAEELSIFQDPPSQAEHLKRVLRYVNENLKTIKDPNHRKWLERKRYEIMVKLKELEGKKPTYEWKDYTKEIAKLQDALIKAKERLSRWVNKQLSPTELEELAAQSQEDMTPVREILQGDVYGLEEQIAEYQRSPEEIADYEKWHKEQEDEFAKYEATPPNPEAEEGLWTPEGEFQYHDEPAEPKNKPLQLQQEPVKLSSRAYTLQENRLNPQLHGPDNEMTPYAASDKPVSREYLQQLVEDDGKSYEETKDDSKWQKVLLSNGKDWTRKEIRDHYAKNADKILKEIKGKPVMIYLGTEKNKNILKRHHNDKPIVINNKDDLMYWADRRLLSLHRVFGPKTKLGFVDLDVHGDVSDATVKKYAREIAGKIKSKYHASPIIYDSGGSGYHIEFNLKEEKDIDALRDELRALCEELNDKYDGFTAGIVKGTGVRTDTTTLKNNGNIRVPYTLHESKGGVKKPLGSKKALSNRGMTKLAWGISTDDVKKIYELEYKLHMLSQRKELGDNAYLLKSKYETELNRLLDKAMVEFKKSIDSWFESHRYALKNYPMSKDSKEDISYYMSTMEKLYEELGNPPKDMKGKIVLFHKALNTFHANGKMAEYFVSFPAGDEYEFSLKNPTDILDELSSGENYVPQWEEQISRVSEQEIQLIKEGKSDKAGIFITLPKKLAKQFPSLGEHDDSKSHVTVLFIGKVPKKHYKLLEETARKVAKKYLPFELELDQKPTYFPPNDHTEGCKVAKMKVLSETLHKLHEDLKKALTEAGVEVDDHFPNYKPHVTLQYMLPPKNKFDDDIPDGSWIAEAMEIWGLGKPIKVSFEKVLSKRAAQVDYPKKMFDEISAWVRDNSDKLKRRLLVLPPEKKIISKVFPVDISDTEQYRKHPWMQKMFSFEQSNGRHTKLAIYMMKDGPLGVDGSHETIMGVHVIKLFNALRQLKTGEIHITIKHELIHMMQSLMSDFIRDRGFFKDKEYKTPGGIPGTYSPKTYRPKSISLEEDVLSDEEVQRREQLSDIEFFTYLNDNAEYLKRFLTREDHPAGKKKIFEAFLNISPFLRNLKTYDMDKYKKALKLLHIVLEKETKATKPVKASLSKRAKKTCLFAYGTLKNGGENHYRLKDSVLVGPAETQPLYTLISIDGSPTLVSEGNEDVMGEIYAVDEPVLKTIDQYEHPYIRKPVQLTDGTMAEAYFYPNLENGVKKITDKEVEWSEHNASLSKRAAVLEYPKKMAEQMAIGLKDNIRSSIILGLEGEEPENWFKQYQEFDLDISDTKQYQANKWLRDALDKLQHKGFFKKIGLNFIAGDKDEFKYFGHTMGFKNPMILLSLNIKREHDRYKKYEKNKKSKFLEFMQNELIGALRHELTHMMQEIMNAALAGGRDAGPGYNAGLPGKYSPQTYKMYGPFDTTGIEEHTMSDVEFYPLLANIRTRMDAEIDHPKLYKHEFDYLLNKYPDLNYVQGTGFKSLTPAMINDLLEKRFKDVIAKNNSRIEIFRNKSPEKFKKAIRELHRYFAEIKKKYLSAGFKDIKLSNRKTSLSKRADVLFKSPNMPSGYNAQVAAYRDFKPENLKIRPGVSFNPKMEHSQIYKDKPYYAIWTSTLKDNSSHWLRWNVSNEFRDYSNEQAPVFDVSGAKVYHMNSVDDYEKLKELFPRKTITTYGDEVMVGVDWDAFAKQYDGVHLANPDAGRYDSDTGVEGNRMIDWDVESTAWFNPKALKLVDVGQIQPIPDKERQRFFSTTLERPDEKEPDIKLQEHEKPKTASISKRASGLGLLISPEGKVYDVGFQGHDEFAARMLQGELIDLGFDYELPPTDFLIKNGWIRIGSYGGRMSAGTYTFDDKILRMLQDVLSTVPRFKSIYMDVYGSGEGKNIPYDDFLTAKHAQQLKDFNIRSHYVSSQQAKDPLSTYHKKRDPDKTPEPEGKVEKGDNKHRFVIQNHHASHHHWDLRLENDKGAMSSWALPKHHLPKGKERVMAQQVEDHPISYNKFTGTIPAGEYGAGNVKRHDIGTYELIKWTKDTIKFRLKGKKEHGAYTLHRTGGKSWILMVMKDEEDKD